MLLSHVELVNLIKTGVIDAPIENVNGASIDITLGNKLMIEDVTTKFPKVVDLKEKQNIDLIEFDIDEHGVALNSGEFALATSNETFNLPNNIACEYKLKSSLARNGLNHMLAGWCDPGWKNAKLTLELHNVLKNHVLLLKAGMKIGQMVFWYCNEVPEEHSYATKGQYNNQDCVTPAKALK